LRSLRASMAVKKRLITCLSMSVCISFCLCVILTSLYGAVLPILYACRCLP
jgi:hypothetical protein